MAITHIAFDLNPRTRKYEAFNYVSGKRVRFGGQMEWANQREVIAAVHKAKWHVTYTEQFTIHAKTQPEAI